MDRLHLHLTQPVDAFCVFFLVVNAETDASFSRTLIGIQIIFVRQTSGNWEQSFVKNTQLTSKRFVIMDGRALQKLCGVIYCVTRDQFELVFARRFRGCSPRHHLCVQLTVTEGREMTRLASELHQRIETCVLRERTNEWSFESFMYCTSRQKFQHFNASLHHPSRTRVSTNCGSLSMMDKVSSAVPLVAER